MPSRTRQTAPVATPAPEAVPQVAPVESNQAVQEQLASEQVYEDALGGRVGGWLHDLVSDNLSPDKVDGYAQDGISAGTGALSDWAVGQASEDQRGDVTEAMGHLTGQLNTSLGQGVVDSNLGEAVSDFALSHPRTMLGAAGLGAAAYILSDQKLDDLDTKIKLGGGNHLLLGGDFGSTLDPSIDAIRGGYRYEDADERFEGIAEGRFDRDAWSLSANYDRKLANDGMLSLDASHKHEADRDLTTGGIRYRDEDLNAYLRGSYDSANGGVGAVSGGFNTLGEGPRWAGEFNANTEGAWNAGLGVSHVDRERDLEWFAKGFAGQDAAGKADYGVRAGLNWRF